MSKLKIKPIFKDIFYTFITEMSVIASFFIIYRLIAINYGPEGVGEYSLARKIAGLFLPFLLLGLGTGLPRFVSMAKDKKERNAYFNISMFLTVIFTSAIFILIFSFREYFILIFFNGSQYSSLLVPFIFFLEGLILHSLVYAYLRGILWAKMLNYFQLLNTVAVPIIIILLLKAYQIETIILYTGLSSIAISLIFYMSFTGASLLRYEKREYSLLSKELIDYSLPRTVGDFVYAVLIALGSVIAVHVSSVNDVGYFSVGTSLLTALGVIVYPIGIIIFPKISNFVSLGKMEEIERLLNYIIEATMQCSVFIMIQLIIFTDVIVRYWLGEEFLEAVPIIRIIFVPITFFIFYVALRHVLDAVHKKPLNTINLVRSLFAYISYAYLMLYVFKPYSQIINLSIAFSLAMVTLGTLTYISAREKFYLHIRSDLKALFMGTVISILFGAIALLFKPFLNGNLLGLSLFESILAISYFVILWLLNVRWVKQSYEMILYRKV